MYKTVAYIVRRIGGREVREMIGEKKHSTEHEMNRYCNRLCDKYRRRESVLCVDVYENGEYQITHCY